MKRPLIVAHRGYPSKAIENTIESFKIAFECGADFIEGDFWLTRDDEIVCLHDEDLLRITNKKSSLKVTEANLSSIRLLSFRDEKFGQGLIIPTLEEIFQLLPERRGLFIEIKDSKTRFVEVLKTKIEKLKFPSERLRIISYHTHILKLSKLLLPDIKTYLIFDWFLIRKKCKNKIVISRFLHLLDQIKCNGIDLNYSSNINAEFVNKIKEAGFEIGIYNINDEESLQKILKLNIDFITTDFPELAFKILKNN
ncbi:MAG: glycerophosphodiester phosphodiesterase [Ignavibacteria bacterium]